ncbi:FAD-dependent oxidoreductase [Telmatocola sphagniphila]|uniref:FAD-dependent oxidoreductase n=1 Tax=Telmatocola sphagniphila TaxID=1123043 RepID=A0A8E6B5U1_9BACT|nr:FAD-dependent oxidoreductase [Telmatocola sphagniphila]QVL31686.1 FAD-dependent oxidoreductase [Telmatocola sphagniphila]
MKIESYKNLVIGSGEAGKYLAWTLAKRGQKTAVVERSMIGGSCPNVACLPSKNVIHSAKAIALVNPTTGLGVVSGSFKVDMSGVLHRKRKMIEALTETHLATFKSTGAELVLGEASFTEPKTVQVALNAGGTRHLRGDRVFLCVGTRASIPDVPGLALAEPMTHVEALDLERLPEHLVILGGGYVGLEFAQAMRRFGSRVTILQRGDRLLEREDPDVSDALKELMKSEGIDIMFRSELMSVTGRSGTKVKLKVRSETSEKIVEATDILIAAGRSPNTDRLNLSQANIELDSRGFVQVNEKLQTSASDVWAMGDCAGSPQFTHVGYDDYRVVLSNLTGGSRTTKGRLIPYCLFTDPELAHVGMTESQAMKKNIPYRIVRLSMAAVPRMQTLSETRGFMKALIGTEDQILGFTVFGAEASEMMAVMQMAMLASLPYTFIIETIFTHPTAAEGLIFLFTKGTWLNPQFSNMLPEIENTDLSTLQEIGS